MSVSTNSCNMHGRSAARRAVARPWRHCPAEDSPMYKARRSARPAALRPGPLAALRLFLALAVAVAPVLAAAGAAAATGQPQSVLAERPEAAAQGGTVGSGIGGQQAPAPGLAAPPVGSPAPSAPAAPAPTGTAARPLAALELYAAPDGDDAASGSIDAPLASLKGARDKLRALKQQGPLPQGGATVYLRGGTYQQEQGLRFGPEDSGTADAPITYAAYPGETPVISGGASFGQADLSAVPASLAARLPQAAQGKAVAVSLFDQGFTAADLSYDEPWWTEGTYQPTGLVSVFVDDTPLHMARYPNKIPGDFGGVDYPRFLNVKDGGEWIEGGQSPDVLYPVLRLPADIAARVAAWQDTEDVMFSGNYSYEWLHEHNLIRSFDAVSGHLEISKNNQLDWSRQEGFGMYYFQNVLEELDVPGEYYIDRLTGTLVLYPPATAGQSFSVKVPRQDSSADAIIECVDAAHITFLNLTFAHSQNSGFLARGGEHVTLKDSVVKNVSGHGLVLGDYDPGMWGLEYLYSDNGWYDDGHTAQGNGRYYTVTGCDIINSGAWGCLIYTGDSSRRDSGHLLFQDNVVEYPGLIHSTPALEITGVGAKLLNNRFAHIQGGGVALSLVDSEFAYNEIRDTFGDLGQDGGALLIATGHRFGLRVHHNLIHQIPSQQVAHSWKPGGVANRLGIYVDQVATGLELTHNVLVGCPIGFTMPNSAVLPITYENNIVIDSPFPIETFFYVNSWMMDKTGHFLLENALLFNYPAGLCDLYKNEWRTIYPEYYDFVNYYINEKTDFMQPMDRVRNNIAININTPKLPPEQYSDLPADGTPDAPTPDPLYGSYGNNQYLTSDPGFVDYAGGNAQLTQEAADSLGIDWIDLSKIGARRDTGGEEPPEPPEPQAYPVLSGFGTWTGSGTASARIDAPTAKFIGLATDGGAELDAAYYSVSEGSTVITLSEAYLKTLANGGYSFVASFTDGQSDALLLTVDATPSGGGGGSGGGGSGGDGGGGGGGTQPPATESGTPPSSVPGTGDGNALVLAAVAAASLATSAVLLIGRRLRQRRPQRPQRR